MSEGKDKNTALSLMVVMVVVEVGGREGGQGLPPVAVYVFTISFVYM